MRKHVLLYATLAVILSVILFSILRGGSAKPDLFQQVDKIVVLKSEHTMTLYAGGHPVKTFRVALGRGSGTAKQREGDHETPEGNYVIDAKNIRSRFHLALHVSYPSAQDKANAAHQDVQPGGDIMIHGVHRGFGWLGDLQHDVDWTDGCIALTNPEMDEIWKAVPTGTHIEIRH